MSTSNKIGTFYGVGVGPGDPSLLTLKAVQVFQKVDIIFQATGSNSEKSISGLVVDSVENCRAAREELVFTMARDLKDREAAWKANAEQIVEALREGKDCAFATIGDSPVKLKPCSQMLNW